MYKRINLEATVQDQYGKLKAAHIKVYGRSKSMKQQDLINILANPASLGDVTPNCILRNIQDLTNEDYQAVERAMLLHLISPEVRKVISTASNTVQSNEELARMATAVDKDIHIAWARAGSGLADQLILGIS